jgi:hypothetical protein
MQTLALGINNYTGTDNDLTVCVNDAEGIHAQFGGQLLTDRDCTRKSFLAAMEDWVDNVPAWHGPNDYGLCAYSGHGTYLPDQDGDEGCGKKGRDECVVAADLKEIRDDEIHKLLDFRRRDARLIFITDSCFSGTVYRKLHVAGDPLRARYLPPANFGRHGRALRRGPSHRQPPLAGVVHIAACSDLEYAYEGEHNGVLTGALLKSYHPSMTIGEWFNAAVRIVKKSGYPQTPQINCTGSALQWPVPHHIAHHSKAA